jgi:transcriptional regulator with XRE-family HTH domain
MVTDRLCRYSTLFNPYVEIFRGEIRNRPGAEIQHSAMMPNRIKELREVRGWSMRDLADRLGTSGSTVNKLEKGQTALNIPWMERLAAAFGVPIETLVSSSTKSDARDDVSRYLIKPDGPKDFIVNDTQHIYEVNAPVLDQIGVVPGTLLVVEVSPEIVASLDSEDIVIARRTLGSQTLTLLRQYIAPSLLITNSSRENAPVINLRTDDAGIKGVVVASHNRHRKKR